MLFWIMVLVSGFLVLAFCVILILLIQLIINAPKHSMERKKRLLYLLGFLIAVILLCFLLNCLDSMLNGGIEYFLSDESQTLIAQSGNIPIR